MLVSLIAAISERSLATSALADPVDDSEGARRLLPSVNRQRAPAGLVALRPSERLDRTAQDYARRLADWGRLSHTGPDGSSLGDRLRRGGYRARVAGENLGAGDASGETIVRLWMESAGHRRNMLMAEAREAGLGLARRRRPTADGLSHFYVLLVAAPM